MAYATLTDLAAWTGTTPGPDDSRLLQRASELIDVYLIGAVYDVDSLGNPTGAAVIKALQQATCAQVEWMAATGDELGVSDQWQEMSLGPARLMRPARGGGASRIGPRVLDILTTAGLRPNPVLR